MTPKERESYAEDLEARRGVSPGDNIFSVSVVTYYRQRNHGTPSEEWREWCKVTRDVQRAASTLLGALEAVKASPLPRQHLLYANNYATGIAVSGDPEWALDGWYRAGECAAFLLGRDDGKALLASLRDLASDDHRPLHRLEQHEPETAEQVINLSEGEAPAGVNPLHWLCWQMCPGRWGCLPDQMRGECHRPAPSGPVRRLCPCRVQVGCLYPMHFAHLVG